MERKNWVIQEMARIMFLNKNIPQKFWDEDINTTCHISNLVYFRDGTKKTPYKQWNGEKPKVKYFQVSRVSATIS